MASPGLAYGATRMPTFPSFQSMSRGPPPRCQLQLSRGPRTWLERKGKKKKKIDKTRASPPRGRAISGGEEQHPRQPASYLPPIPIRHRYNRDNLRHPVDFPTSARGIMSLQPPPFFLPLRHFSFFATFSFKQVSQATIAREFEEGCLRDNFTPLDNMMCNLKGGGSIGCIKG